MILLSELKCPKCKIEEFFLVGDEITTLAIAYGVDKEWADDTPCTCSSCGVRGPVSSFKHDPELQKGY